jgi:phage shock protein A
VPAKENSGVKELKRRVEAWSNRAEMARKMGNAELVDQALEQKRQCENELAKLQEFELTED